MNNLADFSRNDIIKYIDSTIESLLKDNNIKWENDTIYSWNWDATSQELAPLNVYNIYGISSMPAKSEGDFSTLKSKFWRLSEKSLLKRPANNKFVLELSIKIYRNNIDPAMIVVSNVSPGQELLQRYSDIHSEVGKWYTGLE